MKFVGLLVASLAVAGLPVVGAPVGTAFTYQGSLKKDGAPVLVPQDFQFGLYGSAGGTDQVGTTVSLTGVAVENGLFNVDLDFGPGAFGSEQRFLQVMVRPSDESVYTDLAPRAAIRPAPLALAVAPLGVSSSAIQDGAITREKLAASYTSKYFGMLTANMSVYYPEYPQFVAQSKTEDMIVTSQGVQVMTAGLYAVATKLTIATGTPVTVTANISVDNKHIKTLTGNIVLSSVDIVHIPAGGTVKVAVGADNFGATLRGDSPGLTTLDIVRID